MSVTVKYVNGTAAVFASHEEALAQAAHDNSFPGHVNADYIVDGDHSERHSNWRDGAPDDVWMLANRDEISQLHCDCTQCEWQRVAPNTHPFEREEAHAKLVASHRFGGGYE